MVEVRKKSFLKLRRELVNGGALVDECFEGLGETRNAAARILDDSETREELRVRFEAEQARKKSQKPEREPSSTIFDHHGQMFQMHPIEGVEPTQNFPYSVEYQQVRYGDDIKREVLSVKLAFQEVVESN